MILSRGFRKFLCLGTLAVVPVNLRIMSRSSILMQDMTWEAPTTFNSTVVEDANDLLQSSVGSLLALAGSILAETTEAETSAGDETDEDNEGEHGAEPLERIGLHNPLAKVPSMDDPNTFAGCLQIMDDNHFLVEWLAYHWHVMPLRRLIVFPDPNSKTSPQHILDRWKDRINITVWDDEKYIYPEGPPKAPSIVLAFRVRQRQFVRRCLLELKKEGREWVFLTDSDEYITINDRVRDPKDPLSPVAYAGKNLAIPDREEHGSVLQFLQLKDTIFPHTNESLATIACLTVSRKIFGTKDLTGQLEEDLHGFNPHQFQTLRWRNYGKDVVKPAKSIMNLKRIDLERDLPDNPSIHRPIEDKGVCNGKIFLSEDESILVANHYPATWEQMLFRENDARGADENNITAYRAKRFKAYQKYSKLKDSGGIRKWLLGFIKSVGEDEAKRLLQHVGDPKEAGYADSEEIATSDLASSTFVSNDNPNAFAGCLLVMDDNHFLIEWLAYHWHVMPLRRLIIMADPHSRTSPAPILDRWKHRIDISQVFEKDIFPDGIPPPPGKKTERERVGIHRVRQQQFVRFCLRTLHEEGREWVVLTDTDEYTMINDRVRKPNDKLSPEKSIGKSLAIPPQREPGSILKFLRSEEYILPLTKQNLTDNPCITMNRKTFGTKKLQGASSESVPLVVGYSSDQFQTFAWRYWKDEVKPGKTLVNLRKVSLKDVPRSPSVHRPFEKKGPICKGPIFMKERDSPFVVNHYQGNLEQMLFRVHDSRGNFTNATEYRTERFNNLTKIVQNTETETIQAWLPGFIESVGIEEAQELLKDVGKPSLAAGVFGSFDTPAQVNSKPDVKKSRARRKDKENAHNQHPVFAEGEPDTIGAEGGQPDATGDAEAPPLHKLAHNDLQDVNATSFSACLQLQDDTRFLPEWLAFHYHTLPLRRLVVHQNPDSSTSPKPILDRWSTMMDITVWEDDIVFPNGPPKTGTKEQLRKDREKQFVKRCLQKLHKEKRDWVVLTTSVAEYTMINNRVRDSKDALSPLSYMSRHVTIPSQDEPGSVSKLLRQTGVTIPHTKQEVKNNPCITMARKLFSTWKPANAIEVSPGFSSSNFQTLTWNYFDNSRKAVKPGKVMINLSQIGFEDILKRPSTNRPLSEGICKGGVRLDERESVFVVNRYPLVLPHDVEGSNGATEKNMVLENKMVQAWLPGFIASVGQETARKLLAGSDPAAVGIN